MTPVTRPSSAPRRKPIAPTRSDLPAPVSPVRRLRPPVKLTESRSIRAKSLTVSSSSTGAPRPSQLGPQKLEEIEGFGDVNARFHGRARNPDLVAWSKREGLLSVDGEHRPGAPALLHRDRHRLRRGDDEGAVGEGEGADGVHDHR